MVACGVCPTISLPSLLTGVRVRVDDGIIERHLRVVRATATRTVGASSRMAATRRPLATTEPRTHRGGQETSMAREEGRGGGARGAKRGERGDGTRGGAGAKRRALDEQCARVADGEFVRVLARVAPVVRTSIARQRQQRDPLVLTRAAPHTHTHAHTRVRAHGDKLPSSSRVLHTHRRRVALLSAVRALEQSQWQQLQL